MFEGNRLERYKSLRKARYAELKREMPKPRTDRNMSRYEAIDAAIGRLIYGD